MSTQPTHMPASNWTFHPGPSYNIMPIPGPTIRNQKTQNEADLQQVRIVATHSGRTGYSPCPRDSGAQNEPNFSRAKATAGTPGRPENALFSPKNRPKQPHPSQKTSQNADDPDQSGQQIVQNEANVKLGNFTPPSTAPRMSTPPTEERNSTKRTQCRRSALAGQAGQYAIPRTPCGTSLKKQTQFYESPLAGPHSWSHHGRFDHLS